MPDIRIRALRRVLDNRYAAIITYIVLTGLTAIILAWRSPNMLDYSNFYAEDGSVFFQNIQDKGVLGSLLAPFNGYFIVGLYLLCDTAMAYNSLFGDGLWSLAHSYGLAAIIFLAAAVALPYLLFSRHFGRLPMLLVVLFGALMPLPQTPFTVIGTIGNQKFTFTYIAFLLIIYRLLNWKGLGWKKLVIIDSALLICAYTSSVTYALLPLLALPYIAILFKQRHHLGATIRNLLRDRGLISLLALVVLAIPQLVYVAINGIPHLANYLDTPYDSTKTTEIFGNRTLLYGLTHRINAHLNDWLVIIAVLVMLVAGWFALRGKERIVFFAGIYASLVASLLFVINRPGVSDFFANYDLAGSGPDQFFFAQTLTMYIPITLLAFGIARLVARYHLYQVVLILFVSGMVICGISSVQKFGTLWKNQGTFENYNRSFTDQAVAACASTQTGDTTLNAYVPGGHSQAFTVRLPRGDLCNGRQQHYQSSVQDLKLQPFNNQYRVVQQSSQVRQTFTSSQGQLEGFQLFLSSFGNPYRDSRYSLTLYDQDCRQVIRKTSLPSISPDNAWYRARFHAIPDSHDKTYCFDITAIDSQDAKMPLAVQLSAPDTYPQGELRLDGKPSDSDLVFKPLYNAKK